MSNPNINIDPSKPSELEFDVSVQEAKDGSAPSVRLVMALDPDCECMFKCEHVEGDKWRVKLPKLDSKQTSVSFRIEVITDGCYFDPVQGTAVFVTTPDSKTTPSKPVVSALAVKQGSEDEEPKKSEEDEQVGRMPVAQYGGEMSPTNQHLEPEFEPTQSDVKIGNAPVYDQLIDKTKIEDIASSVTPGETTDPEPQHGNNVHDEGDEEEDDEEIIKTSVAESIVRSVIGGVITKPITPGVLFKRDKEGKAVVEGIDSPEVAALKAERAIRVKVLLNL